MVLRFSRFLAIAISIALGAFPGQLAARTASSLMHAYQYKVTTLTYKGEQLFFPEAINDSDQVVGTILFDGGACAYYSQGSFSMFGAGYLCDAPSINDAGIAVGATEQGNGNQDPVQGMIYGDGLNEDISGPSAFGFINDEDVIAGVQPNGNNGIYDLKTGTWTNVADPKTGCADIYLHIITDSGIALGGTSCGVPNNSFVAISKNRYHYVTPPNNLGAATFNDAETAVLQSAQCPADAFLWKHPWSNAPLDLGTIPGDSGDCYRASGISTSDEVIGWTTGGYNWVWDSVNGMRDLAKLANLSGLTAVQVTAISKHGHILAQAKTSGGWVWLILDPLRS